MLKWKLAYRSSLRDQLKFQIHYLVIVTISIVFEFEWNEMKWAVTTSHYHRISSRFGPEIENMWLDFDLPNNLLNLNIMARPDNLVHSKLGH